MGSVWNYGDVEGEHSYRQRVLLERFTAAGSCRIEGQLIELCRGNLVLLLDGGIMRSNVEAARWLKEKKDNLTRWAMGSWCWMMMQPEPRTSTVHNLVARGGRTARMGKHPDERQLWLNHRHSKSGQVGCFKDPDDFLSRNPYHCKPVRTIMCVLECSSTLYLLPVRCTFSSLDCCLPTLLI